MSAGPSAGTTAYERTSLTVDDERLDAVFEREVFTPTFDDDDVVSTADELEIVLGVPVADETDDRPESDDADAEVEASSVTESNAIEPEPDASHSDEVDSTTADDAETGADVETDTEAVVGPTPPGEMEQFTDENRMQVPTEQEYSALRRLRSRFGDSSEDSESDTEARDRMERYGTSGDASRSDTDRDDVDGDENSTNEEGDKNLPVVKSDSRIKSWVNQLRDYLR